MGREGYHDGAAGVTESLEDRLIFLERQQQLTDCSITRHSEEAHGNRTAISHLVRLSLLKLLLVNLLFLVLLNLLLHPPHFSSPRRDLEFGISSAG